MIAVRTGLVAVLVLGNADQLDRGLGGAAAALAQPAARAAVRDARRRRSRGANVNGLREGWWGAARSRDARR